MFNNGIYVYIHMLFRLPYILMSILLSHATKNTTRLIADPSWEDAQPKQITLTSLYSSVYQTAYIYKYVYTNII